MTTITLPPELEQAISRRAELQGTTVELLTLDGLHKMFPLDAETPAAAISEREDDGTMHDFLKDFIGVFDSRTIIPGGANYSEDTGKRFTEILLEDRERKRHQQNDLCS